MRIGVDCRIYTSKYTGIGRYVYELAHRIPLLDSTNEYVFFFNAPEYESFHEPAKNVRKVLADAPIYSLREQTHFLKILNKEHLDLMHFTHFNAPIFYNRPFVVTIHDLTLSFFPGKKKRSLMHRIAYHMTLKHAVRKAKTIITISKNSKKDLQSLLHVPTEKIEVIYQGISAHFKPIHDKQILESALKKYNIRQPFLLYTGVMRSHKNIPNLIRAFHDLKTKYHNKNLSLVLTGKEDPLYPEVREIARKMNLEKDIIFSGLIPENDLVALYCAAKIYVFPSLYEGFGLPPLEAFACETPVAASDSSSIPEICGKGNAVFFNPNDYHDIAQKIHALLGNHDLQETLKQNGKNRVKDFDWGTTAGKTLEVYNSCMEK